MEKLQYVISKVFPLLNFNDLGLVQMIKQPIICKTLQRKQEIGFLGIVERDFNGPKSDSVYQIPNSSKLH